MEMLVDQLKNVNQDSLPLPTNPACFRGGFYLEPSLLAIGTRKLLLPKSINTSLEPTR